MPEVTVPATQSADEAKKDIKDVIAEGRAANAAYKPMVKEIDFDGYKFKLDTDMLDDVAIVDLIDEIETQKRLKSIVTFLHFLIGEAEYEKLVAFFKERDGRFKLTKLSELYYVIFENFDPKG